MNINSYNWNELYKQANEFIEKNMEMRSRNMKRENIEKPSVTLIVPVYNVEKYVEKCIQSLINQSYKNDYEK